MKKYEIYKAKHGCFDYYIYYMYMGIFDNSEMFKECIVAQNGDIYLDYKYVQLYNFSDYTLTNKKEILDSKYNFKKFHYVLTTNHQGLGFNEVFQIESIDNSKKTLSIKKEGFLGNDFIREINFDDVILKHYDDKIDGIYGFQKLEISETIKYDIEFQDIIDAVQYGFKYRTESQNDNISVPEGNILQWFYNKKGIV